MAAITPSKIVAIHLKAIKIETIYVNKKKSQGTALYAGRCVNKDSLNSKAKRAEFLSHILQGTSESNKLIRSKLRCLSVDYVSVHLMCQPRARFAGK